MIPEIDIWRAALLMLKRFGDNAPKESAMRAGNLETEGDRDGAAIWRRITDAVEQLANPNAGRPGALTASAAGPVNPSPPRRV